MEIHGDQLEEFAHVAVITKSWEFVTPEMQQFRVTILHYPAHGGILEHFAPRVEVFERLVSGEKWVEKLVSSAATTEAEAFREAMSFIRRSLQENN